MLLFNDSHLKLTCSSVTEPFQVAQSNRTKVAPKESRTNGDSSLLWSHCLYFSGKTDLLHRKQSFWASICISIICTYYIYVHLHIIRQCMKGPMGCHTRLNHWHIGKSNEAQPALSGASYDESNTWSKHSHSIDKLPWKATWQSIKQIHTIYKCDIIVLKNSHMWQVKCAIWLHDSIS